MTRSRVLSSVLLALVLVLPACAKKDQDTSSQKTAEPEPPKAEPPKAEPPKVERPEGPVGSIEGIVKFVGEAPEMPMLSRGSDPICAATEMRAETILAKDGAFANVVVRVAPGTVKGWVPSAPVVVDQKECMYRPRVQAGVVGQRLEVKNSDGTSHNVHVRAMELGKRQGMGTISNVGQPAGAPPIKSVLTKVDVVKLKCDSHGWMSGYVLLSDNPYAAVSGADGSFVIKDVPVGTIELQAWHEFYGVKSATVTVEEGKAATVEFSYDADADNPTK